MQSRIPTVVQSDIEEPLREFLRRGNYRSCAVISDHRTHAVLGARVDRILRDVVPDCLEVPIDGEEVLADEATIFKTFRDLPAPRELLVSVGSGTVTDITRFVASRSGAEFLAMPTAPSVDGFTSYSSPIIIDGFKQTIVGIAPTQIITDPDVLRQAPAQMIAAGFGDVIGKTTAVADWHLGAVLRDDAYDSQVAADVTEAFELTLAAAEEIGRRSPEAIETLFRALAVTGESMARVGSSAPASGSEHQFSHFLEMKLLYDRRPAVLHGAKVALGTLVSASLYERLRALRRGDIAGHRGPLPDFEEDARRIRDFLGAGGEAILADQEQLMATGREEVESLRRRLLDRWEEVQEIAAAVPPRQTLAAALTAAGGATEPEALGFSREEYDIAAYLSHYVRTRFSVQKLFYLLQLAR